MNGKSWRKIEEIFGEAMELPHEERASFLDQACGDNAELRREIEAWLRADAKAGGFLEGAATIPELSAAEVPTAEVPTAEVPPNGFERLGPYRILRQIGQGGMGTVYLAERDDDTFSRRVAIKVLRRGTETPKAVERFERERQILATLAHPSIARLLDGGTTAEGMPYVVMEYIEGEPIDEACHRRRLGPEARVDLILAICDAVTTAHRNLVVHRDLKPSNILIDHEGNPKLLDFGIAKLLEPNEYTIALEPTASWDRRLTPSYASPEQLRGDRMTVATDVYLLGVVLYRLLTGQSPHRLEGCSLVEVERKITTEVPPRPSTLAPGLDTDLDSIVLKALRSDPEGRYGSVEALAEDLRRYRSGLPVLARKGTFRYLAGKFLRRHRIPVVTAVVFLLLVTTFAISTVVQAKEIKRTLGRLIAVEGFIVDLFGAANPEVAKGRLIPVQEVLERGERQLRLGNTLEPGSRGLLHALFGRIALHLGDLEDARSQLEAARAAYTEAGDDRFLELAEIRARADLARALLYLEEDPKTSETLARGALEDARPLLEEDPLGLLELLNNLVTIYCLQGKWEEAEPFVEEAYALVEGSRGNVNLQQAITLSMKALLLRNKAGEPEEAHRLYEQSLAIYRQIEGEVHPDLAAILNQLGLLSRDGGDFETAVSYFEESLQVRQALYPEGHWEVGQSLFQVGVAERRAGDLVRAEDFTRRAWEVYAKDPSRGPNAGRTRFMWFHLAEIRLALGRAEEAEAMLEELPPEWWTTQKPTGQLLPLAQRAKGCTLAALGELDAAESLLTESLPATRRFFGDEAWETGLVRECLTTVKTKRQGAS